MAALRGKALIAYLVVCVFWGSTYLAIRIGVGELPPFLFAGLRFLVAVRYANSDYIGDEPRMRDLEKHPGVLECHHVAGEDCYILKVAAPDLESLQGILRDLRGPSAKMQMSTRTTIVLGTVFEKPGFVPVEPD